MELREFVAQVPGFANLPHPDRIIHFGWFLHRQRNWQRFDQPAIRACYDDLNMEEPNLSLIFRRLLEKRPKVILKDGSGYFLEHKTRESLDKKYGLHETTIALSHLLNELPGKVSDEAERLFLSEAIKCYHHKAFRAAIVMTWNLAYDHLLNWILKDPSRLMAFNSKIIARIGAKRGAGLVISKREDFEEFGEQETLDIASNSGLFTSGNTKKVLDIQLTKRNMAAHPSLLSIEGPQADDTISSLVNNIVLVLR